ERKAYCRLDSGGSPVGLADDRKPVNLMTVHVSKSVTVHEVSNSLLHPLNWLSGNKPLSSSTITSQ
ncbi:hypothetical protein, partial [Roseburia intestinalis]|uniref:hypothetical protein n=1 Tax=Roseburia intestinalis TaxID=166486 RepID=UPI003BAA22AF